MLKKTTFLLAKQSTKRWLQFSYMGNTTQALNHKRRRGMKVPITHPNRGFPKEGNMIYEVLREEGERMDTESKTAVNDEKHPFVYIMASGVQSEEDLKPRSEICINPPPSDGQCECCGKHISHLKPFGKAGDPCVGDFEGAYLVKGWRPVDPSYDCVGSSWECRDCILLDDNEYFEKLANRFSEEKKTN